GASNVISSTYFNISQNGNATISSTTCVDTSNGNTTVTNTSTLGVGTHVIRCTVTKSTGTSANAQTTIVVNAAYTGIGSGTYQPGQVVTFAGIQWNVMNDNGTSVTLITKDVLSSSQLSSNAPKGFYKDDKMGHCARPSYAPEYHLYCFSNTDSHYRVYSWEFSGIKKTIENWLNGNSVLLQAKEDGGLINMSFSDGISNYNGYVRIITHSETLSAYNAGYTWHSNPDFKVATLTSQGGSRANGSNLVFAVNTDGSVGGMMATITLSGWGGQYGALVRPVIQVKK
ncbi:MAG TPA: hypothetical protein GX747_03550, partial [Tenericutes bacterium]|nr:hypothetical protein [Mycoplasmatota bacterium]